MVPWYCWNTSYPTLINYWNSSYSTSLLLEKFISNLDDVDQIISYLDIVGIVHIPGYRNSYKSVAYYPSPQYCDTQCDPHSTPQQYHLHTHLYQHTQYRECDWCTLQGTHTGRTPQCSHSGSVAHSMPRWWHNILGLYTHHSHCTRGQQLLSCTPDLHRTLSLQNIIQLHNHHLLHNPHLTHSLVDCAGTCYEDNIVSYSSYSSTWYQSIDTQLSTYLSS